MSVIGKVTPINKRKVKQTSQEWFDGEIPDEIKNRDKLKSLKSQNYTSTKIFILRQDIN